MNTDIRILSVANSLATHAYKRQGLIANNIANADTPEFRARDLSKFQPADNDFAMRSSRPGHFMDRSQLSAQEIAITAGFGSESPNGNTVSIEDQMIRSSEIKMQHDLALGVYQKSMAILRLSLGRR